MQLAESLSRKLQKLIGLQTVDAHRNLSRSGTESDPRVCWQDENGDSSCGKVLLVSNALIGSDEEFEIGIHCSRQEIAVSEFAPSEILSANH